MTPAKDVVVTIGEVQIRLGDIVAYDGLDVVLKNGMRIKRQKFKVKTAK